VISDIDESRVSQEILHAAITPGQSLPAPPRIRRAAIGRS
jgi:hypothetical protein